MLLACECASGRCVTRVAATRCSEARGVGHPCQAVAFCWQLYVFLHESAWRLLRRQPGGRYFTQDWAPPRVRAAPRRRARQRRRCPGSCRHAHATQVAALRYQLRAHLAVASRFGRQLRLALPSVSGNHRLAANRLPVCFPPLKFTLCFGLKLMHVIGTTSSFLTTTSSQSTA